MSHHYVVATVPKLINIYIHTEGFALKYSLHRKNLNIIKRHIKDENKFNIDFLFHLVQRFKIFHFSYIYTKLFTFQFIIFTSYTSTPLYILIYSPSCHSMSNAHRPKMI